MKLQQGGNIIEIEVDGKKYTKVSYSIKEEIANCVTHGVAMTAYIGGLIYMLSISFDARSYAASLITCFSAILVYAVSTIYHAVQDTVKKYYLRKLDHSDIPFLVLGCNASVCLLLSAHPYNYVALGISVALALISGVLSVKNVDKYKAVTITMNFVIGAVMLAAFILNFGLIAPVVKYLYLAGAILCTTGSILFGIKVKYMHAIFHVFITAGTLCFYAGSVLILQSYVPF